MLRQPEDFWKIEDSYRPQYEKYVAIGEAQAANAKVCFVAIARNAMPHLENTLTLIDQCSHRFSGRRLYVYENDSVDATGATLDAFAATRQWVTVEHDTLGRPDYRGFESDRTVAMAEYRNRCRHWAEQHAADADYIVVVDMDPHGGFSVDGVMNSIGWLGSLSAIPCGGLQPGAMASYSLYTVVKDGQVEVAHYDAFAARLNWWEDRREIAGYQWFFFLFPPVGSDPIPMNSAFGGLCVYRREAFLAPGVHYCGGDCEHVCLHKSMKQAGYQLYLNPGCRYVAILPEQP
jgi:hypothetical protein